MLNLRTLLRAASLVLLERVMARRRGKAGFGVIYGIPGLGKTEVAIHLTNKADGVLICGADHFTRKTFLEALLREMLIDIPKRASIGDMINIAAAEFADHPDRPLVIDEADKLTKDSLIETVRYLHDTADMPLVLIGEKDLPRKLAGWERMFDRSQVWLEAPRCDDADVRKLLNVYLPHVEFPDEMLPKIRENCEGKPRRVIEYLEQVEEWAAVNGAKSAVAFEPEFMFRRPAFRDGKIGRQS